MKTVFAVLLLCALTVYGQTSFGRISGNVTDASGSALGGAKVILTNPDTQDTRNAVTDDQGYYLFTNLPIGKYTIEVTQTGFQKKQQTGVSVFADARLTSDFQLTVGDVNQSIEVVASAGETLNTVSGELARSIDQKQVENLALNGGNYIELLTLVPGAVVTNPDQFSVTTSLSATNQNINGNRGDSQNLTVDGAFNLVAGSNGSLMNNINSNFIQEVKIQTSNFSAEYGRTSGAAFNVVTKNGTNQYHGNAWELFRNDALDARNYFSVVKPKLRFNDFGYSVGGPIAKNKIFFFWGQEWKRLRQNANPSRQTLPGLALLDGNFAGQAVIFEPGTRNPIPNNNLAPYMTTDGKAMAAVYRTMAKQASFYTGVPGANNTILQPDNPLDFRQHIIRLDYRRNEKSSFYGRWVSDRNSLVDPYGTFSGSNLPTTPTLRNRPGESYLIAHTWLPTNTVVNEFRMNASWASQNIPPYGETWKRSTYGFQFPQLYTGGDYNSGIPDVAVAGFANYKGPSFALHSPSTDIMLGDTVSYIRKGHIMKAGFTIVRDRVDQNGRPSYTGNMTFNASGNPMTTGSALADMLTGNFRTYSEASSDPMGFFRFWQPGFFAQDSWKVSRRLNLEIGMRSEILQPMYTQGNNMASFDPSKYVASQAVVVNPNGTLVPGVGNPFNGLVRAGSGVPKSEEGRVPGSTGALFQSVPAGAERGFYTTQSVLAPRFGFAYLLANKTVLRGGYGIFYARPQGNLIFSQVNVAPILQAVQLENGNVANPSGGAGVSAPLSNINSIDPKLKNGSSQQFSMSIQRELPKSLFIEASYVGNLGRHLLRQPDINQASFEALNANAALPSAQRASTNYLRPYAGYSSILTFMSDSTSNYHALQTFLSKRAGRMFFTTSYTWSKALGDSSAQGDNPESYRNRHFNYGPLSYDRRHAFVTTYVLTMPTLKGKNAILQGVAGGWMLNGIIRLQTGQNFNVTGNTAIGGRRADYVGGSKYPENQTINNWLSRAAFAAAPDGRLGNTGVGIVTGPGLQQYNLSVSKNFRVRERYGVRFQTDFFNAFNTANFTGLDTNLANAAFGTLSSAYPPRQIQMQLKFTF